MRMLTNHVIIPLLYLGEGAEEKGDRGSEPELFRVG